MEGKDHGLAYYTIGFNEHYLLRYQFNAQTKQGQAVDLKTLAVDIVSDETTSSVLFTDTAHLSTDGGWTWTDRSANLARACKCDLGKGYIGPVKLLSFRSGDIRALISYRGNAFNGNPGAIAILRSQDSGESWSAISQFDAQGLFGGPFSNPDDPMDFFIVTLSAKGKPGAFGNYYTPDALTVLETKDGGSSWQAIYRHATGGQFLPEQFIRGVAQMATNGGRSLLLATREGLLRSDDEGHSWKLLGGLH